MSSKRLLTLLPLPPPIQYYNEVRPLLTALPFWGTISTFVQNNQQQLDSIHPFPPAELPNFLKGLDGKLREGAPEDITKHDTLGFMDAGKLQVLACGTEEGRIEKGCEAARL